MFWGLIMEPQKRYSQTVKHSFHVSMAAIDVYSATEEPVQVMCGFENRKYLLCTLQKDELRQCALDLNFEIGDKVTFLTNGGSHVHLTGYLHDGMMDDESENEDGETEDISNACGPPAKKMKTMDLLEEMNNLGSDSEDDPDINLSDILEDEDETTFLDEDDDDDDDDDNEVGEEEDVDGEEEAEGEEDDDDDDEVEGEEDDDSDEASPLSSDEDNEKPKINGKAKKAEQKLKEKEKPKEKSPQKAEKTKQPKKTIEGGVVIEEVKLGNGPIAKPGKMVQVYYEGRFKNNNKMFDSSTKGNGFRFRLGKQEVIKGWDVGVSGMKVGGKRRITCPPPMAYGAKGSPPTIPPNSTLVFEVELKGVK